MSRAADRVSAIRGLSDEDAVAALAAASTQEHDPFLANILATEVQNRLRRAQTVTAHLGEGVLGVDRRSRVTLVNPAAERLVGLESSDVVGSPASSVLRLVSHDGQDERFLDKVIEATWSEGGWTGDAWLLTAKAGSMLVSVRTAAIRQEGDVTGAVILLVDASARHLQEQRRAARESVTATLATATDIDSAARDVIEAICKGFHWDVGALWIESREGKLACRTVWQLPELEISGFTRMSLEGFKAPRGGIPGIVFSTGRPFFVEDLGALDEATYPRALMARREGLAAAFAFPLLSAGKPAGVMEFFSREARPLDAETVSATEALGGTIADFVVRRRTEIMLQESEARKRGILQAALDAVVAIDEDSTVIEWNPAAEQMFGYPQAEAMGARLSDLIIPHRLRESHLAGMRRYLSDGRGPVLNAILELPAIRKDGSEFVVELYIVPIESGNGKRLFTSMLRDISDRKARQDRETTLRKLAEAAERRHRDLFELLPAAMLLSDRNARVLDCNAECLRIFKAPRERVVNSAIERMLAGPEEWKRLRAATRAALPGGEPFSHQARLRAWDGTEFDARLRVLFMRDAEGEIANFVGLFEDVRPVDA